MRNDGDWRGDSIPGEIVRACPLQARRFGGFASSGTVAPRLELYSAAYYTGVEAVQTMTVETTLEQAFNAYLNLARAELHPQQAPFEDFACGFSADIKLV